MIRKKFIVCLLSYGKLVHIISIPSSLLLQVYEEGAKTAGEKDGGRVDFAEQQKRRGRGLLRWLEGRTISNDPNCKEMKGRLLSFVLNFYFF